MEIILRGWAVIKSDFISWVYKPKLYLAVIAIVWFVYNNFETVFRYADSIGCRVSFCLVPYEFVHPYMRILLFCCVIFIMADAPFISEMQISMIYRTGKRVWYLSQIIYIMIGSLMLDALFIVSPLLFHMKNIVFQKEWGRVLNSLVSQESIIHPISSGILIKYTPIQVMMYYVVILFLLFSFIGLFSYLTNLIQMGTAGNCIMFGLIIFDWMIYLTGAFQLKWISPISWIRMEEMAYGLDKMSPSMTYAVATLCAINILLCFGIYKISWLTDISLTAKE